MADAVDMTGEGGFVVDFSEIADIGPIPAGRYEASIVKAAPGMSQSGYPKIDLAWKVEDGEYEGRQIFDTLAFHPNALPMTKRKLRQLGFPDNFSGEIDPEDFLGVAATIVVTIEQSNQINEETGEKYEPRNRVSKVANADDTLASILD